MPTLLRRLLIIILHWIFTAEAGAQFNETFNDGSLRAPLAWLDTSGWVQAGGFLRSSETREQHSFVIYTIASLPPAASELEWQARIRLAFNPSSANYLDWFLAADTAPGVARNAYYIRIGNTRDEISLYRLRNGIATEIVSGRDGRLNRSDNTCTIRVRCRGGRYWQVEVVDADRPAWELEGACDDPAFVWPHYQGFRVRQSTQAFHQRHYVDELYFGPARYDTTPPQLLEAGFLNDGRLRLRFSEALQALNDPGTEHYWLEGRGGPDSVHADADPAVRCLRWKAWTPEVAHYLLRSGGICDTAGNRAADGTFRFFGGIPDTPRPGQLLITEIMAAPESGQPEWVELQNVHTRWLCLNACRFSDASSTILLPDSWLAPGERCILQPQNWPGKVGLVKTLRLPMPSLNNGGDTLTLRSASQQILHRVGYNDAWYGNPVFAAGAYSLEMVDTSVWCRDEGNWKACTDPPRSSPGRRNSVSAPLNDTTPPRLLAVYPESPYVLSLNWDEWPVWGSLQTDAFAVQPGNLVPDLVAVDEARQEIRLQFQAPFSFGQVYRLEASGIADCSGNAMEVARRCFALPADSVRPGSLLIHEVLFEPAAGGCDFIELYNPGPQTLDIRGLELLRLDAAGRPVEAAEMSKTGRIMLPGAFLVLCENAGAVMSQYPCHGGDTAFLRLERMPALLAGGGQIAVRRRDGIEIDRVAFHPGMHHPLLQETRGISLERLRLTISGMDPGNWHSAAQDCKGATPGRRNSQARAETAATGQLLLDTEWFTPDNDGHADQAALLYQFPEPGNLLTLRIYDSWGMPVRSLCLHRLCGTRGAVAWDGLRDDGRPAAAGNYILMAEVQDAGGRQQKAKLLLSLLRSAP